MPCFVYDLPRLLWLREAERLLAEHGQPALTVLAPPDNAPHRLAVLAASFNPLTRGHVVLAEAARRAGADAVLLLLPLRAIDKEAVTRAASMDRALTLLQWAAKRDSVGVALVNRGLFVEQAALLAADYPTSEIVFVVGHDKIVQIFDPRYYDERDAALEALFGLASCAVAPRQGQGAAALRQLLEAEENRRFAARVTPLPLGADVDTLSSTAVREAARIGQHYDALVPAETAELLRETLPYSPPRTLPDGESIDPYGLRLALVEAAAANRLPTDADFAALCRTARAETPQGQRLRAWLASERKRTSFPAVGA